MQKVTDSVKALLARYAKITLTAYIDGSKLDALLGDVQQDTSCGAEDAFSFGNACAASVKLTVAASMPGLRGHGLRITWAVDETEYPLFEGKILNASVSAGRTYIEAWDAMYYGGSDLFIATSAMLQTIDAADAFGRIAAAIGVEAADEALRLLEGIKIQNGMGHLPEEASNSAVAGYIAGLVGGNAMIDRAGKLTARQIQTVDFESQPYEGGASAQNGDFAVTGVTLQREDIITIVNEDGTTSEETTVQEFGAGDGTLMVQNPLADQLAADRCYAQLQNVEFRPGLYSFPGGLLLEPGDVFAIHSMDGSYAVAAITLNMSFDGGVKTTAGCGGEMEKGGAQGAINQALATLNADFARLRSLVAENAEIVSAKITHLTAEDITAGRIHSTDFSAVNLPLIYPLEGTLQYSTRSGSMIQINDASNRNLQGLTIYGKTNQLGSPSPALPVPLTHAGNDGTLAVTVASQSLVVATPNGLPGIPVPSGGNYTDENGKQWICDEIDFATGAYIKRVGIAQLAASAFMLAENNGYPVGDSVMFYCFPPGVMSGFKYALCDRLPNDTGVLSKDVNGFYGSGARFYCRIKGVSDTATFKSLMDGATFAYVLATPEETSLGKDQLAAYAKIHTVRPSTIISNSAGAYMTVRYIAAQHDVVFPAAGTYPTNGEQIVRGFEIDFSTGTIRGVFWSEPIENLTARVEAMEEQQADLLKRVQELEKA